MSSYTTAWWQMSNTVPTNLRWARIASEIGMPASFASISADFPV